MEYKGSATSVRVRIIAKDGVWSQHNGQECDATYYGGGLNLHIDSEQLTPPFPKWQNIQRKDVEILP